MLIHSIYCQQVVIISAVFGNDSANYICPFKQVCLKQSDTHNMSVMSEVRGSLVDKVEG